MPEKLPAPYESKKKDFWVKDFAGVNTQADRTSIKENEFAWLENIQPIGYGNLRVVPLQSASLAVIPAGTASYTEYVNIGNVDLLLVFTSGGGGYQVNLSTFVVTLIAVAGTFTGTVHAAQWKNDRALIIASSNYYDWDGAVLTPRGGVTAAPAAGSTIATFAGRVWIGNARTITFSAPNSFTDFQTISSGGSFIITDETFKSNISALTTANNFLYLFGDSAVNVVSDVRVTAGVTLFSNTNLTATFGSTAPQSIVPYYRTIGFSTSIGFHALYGSTPQKISDALDGVFPLIDFTKPISSGSAVINNILCLAYLFQYQDPSTGTTRPLLAVFFNKKWFFCSQGSSLTLISGCFVSGVPKLFGTDGTNIYRLFSDTSSSISWTVQSALWMLKEPVSMKQTLKGGVELTAPAVTTAVTLSVVSEIGSVAGTLSGTNTGLWANAATTQGQWINAALQVGSWLYAGFAIYQGDIEAYGRYIGYNITSTAPATKVTGLLLQYEQRASWPGRN